MAMAAPLQSKKRKLYWDDDEQQSILQLMMGFSRSTGSSNPNPNPNPKPNPNHSPTSWNRYDPSVRPMTLNLLDGGKLQYAKAEETYDDHHHRHHQFDHQDHHDHAEQVIKDGYGDDSFEFEQSDTSSLPLPPGWEKCLDLKTGSMYYLNRSTGIQTSIDPRRHLTSNGATIPQAAPSAKTLNHHNTTMNWPNSPSSSDLTIEPTIAGTGTATASASTTTTYPILIKPTPTIGDLLSAPQEEEEEEKKKKTHHVPEEAEESDTNPNPNPNFCNLDLSLGLGRRPSTTTSSSSTRSRDNSQSRLDGERPASHDALKHHPCEQNLVQLLHPNHHHQNQRINDAAPISHHNHHESSSYDGPMITLGCPHCLMFVMLSMSSNPKCPKCGSSLHNTIMQSNNNVHDLDQSIIMEAKVPHKLDRYIKSTSSFL